MEFFKSIAEHLQDGQQLTLTIKKSGQNLVASIMPDTKSVKDKAVASIQPLVLSGTPEDFENDFEKVFEPIKKTFGLLSDLESYEKDVDETRKRTEMENKKKTETEKLKKQYASLVLLVKKNTDESKFKDAKTVLSKASAMPCADKKEIDNLLAEINRRAGEGDMFGGAADKSDGKDLGITDSDDPENEDCDGDDKEENEEKED